MEIPAPAVLVGQHVSVAGRDGGARRRDRYPEQRRSPRITHFAPIEARVRDQDFDARDQQSDERNYCDPVRHPNEHSMPGISLVSEGGSLRHPGSIAWPRAASAVQADLKVLEASLAAGSLEISWSLPWPVPHSQYKAHSATSALHRWLQATVPRVH